MKRRAVALLVLVGPCFAQDTLGTDDRLLLQRAAKGSALEVRIGQLALENAESQAVKNLGQRMIDDHTRANQELKMLAERKGVKMPADDASPLVNVPMAKVSGAAFDALFRQGIIEDHEKDVAMFEREVASGMDPDLKNWAAKVLITMKEQLEAAKARPN